MVYNQAEQAKEPLLLVVLMLFSKIPEHLSWQNNLTAPQFITVFYLFCFQAKFSQSEMTRLDWLDKPAPKIATYPTPPRCYHQYSLKQIFVAENADKKYPLSAPLFKLQTA